MDGAHDNPAVNLRLAAFSICLAEVEYKFGRVVANLEIVRVSAFDWFIAKGFVGSLIHYPLVRTLCAHLPRPAPPWSIFESSWSHRLQTMQHACQKHFYQQSRREPLLGVRLTRDRG